MKKFIIAFSMCLIIGVLGYWLSRPVDNHLYLKYTAQNQQFKYGKIITHFVINEGRSNSGNEFYLSTNVILNSENHPDDCRISSAKYKLSVLNLELQDENFTNFQLATISLDGFVFSLSRKNIMPEDYNVKSVWEFSPTCEFEEKSFEVENAFIAKRSYLRRFESWFLAT